MTRRMIDESVSSNPAALPRAELSAKTVLDVLPKKLEQQLQHEAV